LESLPEEEFSMNEFPGGFFCLYAEAQSEKYRIRSSRNDPAEKWMKQNSIRGAECALDRANPGKAN
jgi:hypothetical protein